METEQLEKQFSIWNRFLYMILGASITFLLVSSGNLIYGRDWHGFGNYVGGIWSTIQLLATPPAFYLLWGRQWRATPLSTRINTVFGYMVASWINLLSIAFFTESPPLTEYYILLIGSAILILLGYAWAVKRTSMPRDEMFP
ncbi:MAG: hypothetical protein M3Y68_01375 [Chloroflexota bacterium]|nr:hypothetical protein [Chloroflexota bacterium]